MSSGKVSSERNYKLTQLSQNAIHNFLWWIESENDRRDNTVPDGFAIAHSHVSPVKSADPDLLESLIQLDLFPGITSLRQLTDAVFLRWLHKFKGPVLAGYTVERLKALVQENVRLNEDEPDPVLRVISLFADYLTFLRRRGLERLPISYPGVAISHICGLLQRSSLPNVTTFMHDIHSTHPSLKTDWKGFFGHLMKLAMNEGRRDPPLLTPFEQVEGF